MKKATVFTIGLIAGYVISERKTESMDASINSVFDEIRQKVAEFVTPKSKHDPHKGVAELADKLEELHGPVSDEDIAAYEASIIRP